MIHSDLDDPSSLRHKDYVRYPGNSSFALHANGTILWMNWNAISDWIGFYSFLGETIHFYLLCKHLWVIGFSYSVLVDSPIPSLCLHPFSWYSFFLTLFSLLFCSVVLPNPSLTLLKVLYFIQPSALSNFPGLYPFYHHIHQNFGFYLSIFDFQKHSTLRNLVHVLSVPGLSHLAWYSPG